MDNDYLAYFRYSGESVENGYFDLKKSANVLIGIDEIIRYYLYDLKPELSNIKFEIPVRIKKGSWEALIPDNIGDWIQLIIKSGLAIYTVTALKEMAKNDFKDAGFKKIFKHIIKSIKWVINIAKHIGTTKKDQFDDVTIDEINNIHYVGIKNDNDKILYVPKKYLEIFVSTPPKLLSKLAIPIEPNREFSVDFSEKEKTDSDDSETGKISYSEKSIFYDEEDLDEIIFPELEHGKYIELEGHVTRGNENSNTIGFRYCNHILTCYPDNGNIYKDKNILFANCIIKGFVERKDETGNIIEKRPKIRYLDIKPVDDNTNKQENLFNEQ